MFFVVLYTGVTRAETLDHVVIPGSKPMRIRPYPFRTECVKVDPLKSSIDGVVYALLGTDREVIYVGSTINLDRRYEQHKTEHSWSGTITDVVTLMRYPCNKMEDLRAKEYEFIQYYLDAGNTLRNTKMMKPKKPMKPHIFTARKDNLTGKITELPTCVRFRWYENKVRKEKKWSVGRKHDLSEALELARAYQHKLSYDE
jgi:predicted GIY-YIG superfamily endonuclease